MSIRKKDLFLADLNLLLFSAFFNGALLSFQYDIEKGLLLKLDSFLQIQLGTVFRGITPVPDDEVLKLYGNNRFIPIRQVEGERGVVSFETTIRRAFELDT